MITRPLVASSVAQCQSVRVRWGVNLMPLCGTKDSAYRSESTASKQGSNTIESRC